MKICTCIVLAVVSSFYYARGSAQDAKNSYEPAKFPTDQSSLVSVIDFPDYPKNTIVRVFCDVALTKAGAFVHSFCWSNYEDGDLFLIAVREKIDRISIDPARVNGRNVAIWFQYTVQFEKRDETKKITLFPHQFVGIDGTGDGYIGPQRYDNPRIPQGLLNFCSGAFRIWYGMTVPAEGGKPLNVKPLNDSSDTTCKRYAQAVVENGRYIPAFLDGVAEAAAYREVWGGGFDR